MNKIYYVIGVVLLCGVGVYFGYRAENARVPRVVSMDYQNALRYVEAFKNSKVGSLEKHPEWYRISSDGKNISGFVIFVDFEYRDGSGDLIARVTIDQSAAGLHDGDEFMTALHELEPKLEEQPGGSASIKDGHFELIKLPYFDNKRLYLRFDITDTSLSEKEFIEKISDMGIFSANWIMDGYPELLDRVVKEQRAKNPKY